MKIQVPFNYNDELRKAMNYYLPRNIPACNASRNAKLVLQVWYLS